jgi:transposase
LNQIDPRRYLNWVANQIERTGGDIDPDLLLPWKCPIGQIKI